MKTSVANLTTARARISPRTWARLRVLTRDVEGRRTAALWVMTSATSWCSSQVMLSEGRAVLDLLELLGGAEAEVEAARSALVEELQAR